MASTWPSTDGYVLFRPTEFFDRYGPYVLGLLQVLRHCLAVALAEAGVKDIVDGVTLISKRTLEAVDMTIDFLQQKLDDETVMDEAIGTDVETPEEEEEEMFNGLTALKDADLRKLDTFLRKTDADKVLGNLYRITIDTGCVKWICLDHYRQVYRETAMTSFVQCVETNDGAYNSQLGKVTIALKSSTIVKVFSSRLLRQASSVKSLSITLGWTSSSADLVILVNKITSRL
ncbi:hypothetical protein BGZ47_010157 [Haplosporangium gracile]|nr:hypothetical protein BGZ47_010157 [Haplosporangium gracile]